MAKDDLSTARWVARLGLALVLLGALAGMPIAHLMTSDEDEAAVSGLVMGALVGAVVGGVIVGALRGRAGLSRRVHSSRSLRPPALSSAFPCCTLTKVLKDEHYNIRLLAELTLYKYEWTNGGSDPKPNALTLTNVCDFPDFPGLGRTRCAGPEAPPVDALPAWIDFAAWSKTFREPEHQAQLAPCLWHAGQLMHSRPRGDVSAAHLHHAPDCREPDKSCETNKAQCFVASSLPDVSAVPRTVACLP